MSFGHTHYCALQDGKYVDMGAGFLYATNVSQPTDPNGFAVFNHTDLQNHTDLHAGEGQRCTKPGASYADRVEKCRQSSPSKSQCCVEFTENPWLQVSPVSCNPEPTKCYGLHERNVEM